MPRKKTRPRPTGIPGIVRHGEDRFLVRVRWTDKRTGKRRKKEGVATTLAKAVELKENLAKDEAQTRTTSRMRFRDFAVQWAQRNADRLARSTRDRYAVALAHAVAELGDIYVDALIPSDVRAWVARMRKSDAPSTINGRLRVLRSVLEELVEDEILVRNPARKVKTLPERRTTGKRGNALSTEELRKFVVTARALARDGTLAEDVVRMVLVLAWTGMRRGEVLALRWEDWQGDELAIERAVWRGEEKVTKTDDPRRVAVVGPLREVLEQQSAWLDTTEHPGRESGLMFPASLRHAKAGMARRGDGELIWFRSGSVMDKPIAKIVETAEVPPVSCHSFRRTWENLLRQAGVDELVRRSLAGWRTDEAQAIYASVDPAERAQATRRVVFLVMGEDTADNVAKDAGCEVVLPPGTPLAKTKTGLEAPGFQPH